MKFKKTIIVTLLLLSLLMINAVSASSNNDTIISSDVSDDKSTTLESNIAKTSDTTDTIKENENKISTNKAITETTDEDKLSSTKENTLTELSGTFTELRTTINNAYSGSTITLNKDYVYTEGYSTGITINKDLTINGNGHTLNGNQKSRIFQVGQGVHLTLNNIKFINGYDYGDPAGAISCPFYADVTITNCIFTNNIGSNGGAIGANGDSNYYLKLNIDNCEFNNNQATIQGGAIQTQYTALTITNSKFTNNKANYHGGAILASDSKVTITNSEFTKNTAINGERYGNGIYLTNGNTANIHYCVFTDNNVVCEKGSVDLSDSKFINTNNKKTSTNTKKSTSTTTTQKSTIITYRLSLKKVKVKKSAKKLVLTATLKQGKTAQKKKWLTFKFNGKTYKAKTNNKGIAKVNIKKKVLKKLKVGKKIKYQVSYGNPNYVRILKVGNQVKYIYGITIKRTAKVVK